MSNAAGVSLQCAECQTVLAEGERRIETDGGVFCERCFDRLSRSVREALAGQSQDIDYGRALVGAIAGGLGGAAVWWGFTIFTGIAFGLVAIVIGIAVGRGLLMFSGGKRSRGLQILSVSVASISYFYATYLVNRSYMLKGIEGTSEVGLPLLPLDPSLFISVVSVGFELFDLIFLAIVAYEAWTIPAPVRLRE